MSVAEGGAHRHESVRIPVRAWHRPLLVFAVCSAVLAVGLVGGLALDTREVLGEPVWLKPLKFAISFVLYATTLAWMTSLVTRRRRLVWWAGVVVVGASVVELLALVGQSARGRASHFNVATALDATTWMVMGTAILVLYLATVIVAVMVWRSRQGDPVLAAAIRLGLGIALVGMALGGLMTSPTADQVAGMADGVVAVIGAHSVGVPDGGPGLALVGWSTEGGDLRVGHFIGMHALQALPLSGWLVTRLGGGLTVGARVGLVRVTAAAYLGTVGLVTWQALRAQPLLQPDALTLAGLAGIVVATSVAAVVVLRRDRSAAASPESASPVTML